MYKVSLKRMIYPILILTVLIGIILWVFSIKNMEEELPSRGVFVYSKEFNLV